MRSATELVLSLPGILVLLNLVVAQPLKAYVEKDKVLGRWFSFTGSGIVAGKRINITGTYVTASDQFDLHFAIGWNVKCDYVGEWVAQKPPRNVKVPRTVGVPEREKEKKPPNPPVPPAARQGWGLVEVINDPDHLTRSETASQFIVRHIELRINHFRKEYMAHSDPQHEHWVQDYHFNVRIESPPAQIFENKTFELTIYAKRIGSVHTEGIARWGWSDGGIVLTIVKAGKATAGR